MQGERGRTVIGRPAVMDSTKAKTVGLLEYPSERELASTDQNKPE